MAPSDDDFDEASSSALNKPPPLATDPKPTETTATPGDDVAACSSASCEPVASDVTFRVGDRFTSFTELEAKIEAYSQAHFVQLWRRDARTIEAAKKRVGKIANNMSEALKYQSVKYCCIHGGKKFTTQASARASSTFKQDCGFNIYLAASKDGAHLEIRSLLLEHNNHTVSEHLFRHLPQQRRLPPDLQTKAASMLQLRANKKLLREQLEVQSNKAVTLRDLSNLAARKKQGCSRNDLEATVKLLQNKYASTVRLLTDENNELRAIFFQDDAMRRSFEDYPEIIFIDATYKLLETRMSCFLMLVEDGNGESEIVAVGLFAVEDGDTLRWFFNVFKELN